MCRPGCSSLPRRQRRNILLDDLEIEVEEIISEAKIRKLEADYLEVAKGGSDVAIQAVKDFFDGANEGIRWVKRARRDAEPSHLQSLFNFATRAYRQPLSPAFSRLRWRTLQWRATRSSSSSPERG